MEDENPPALEPKSFPVHSALKKEGDFSTVPSEAEAKTVLKKVTVDTTNMPEKEPIKYGVMGSVDIPVDKNEESLYFTSLRIGELQGLEGCTMCKVRIGETNLGS